MDMLREIESTNIKYLPASGSVLEANLSSDIFYADIDGRVYIYDVGYGEAARVFFDSITEKAVKSTLVISHFHHDHTGNLNLIHADRILVSDNTFKHFRFGETVEKEMELDEKGQVTVYPIPSSHEKGSLALRIGNYLLVGDALYGRNKNNEYVYNVQFLKAQMDFLNTIACEYVIVSHDISPVYQKKYVIEKLNSIYLERQKNNPWIKRAATEE